MPSGNGEPPICPDWWPKLVWDLHYWPRPGVGPINLPKDVEDLMGASLHTPLRTSCRIRKQP